MAAGSITLSPLTHGGGLMRSNVILSSTFAIIAGLLLSGAKAPTVDDVREWHNRSIRVETIARKILAANIATCPATQSDFGFKAVTTNTANPVEVQNAWSRALGIDDDLTVIVIHSNGPAQLAGLQYGDKITSVNDVKWSPTPESRATFGEAWKAALATSPLELSVRRGDADLELVIPAEQICAANAFLIRNKRTNAYAIRSEILVTDRMEKLLISDDELAYVIAHEAAHIFLGHSAPDKQADRDKSAARKKNERDADALSLRLMLKAGFPPEAAATAQPRINKATILRELGNLFGIHGPYLPPKERTAFLKAEAAEARAEQEASITAK